MSIRIVAFLSAPVTFAVTNSGTTEHEFYLGDETALTEHEQEMQAGRLMHDDPHGISAYRRWYRERPQVSAGAGQ